MRKFAMAALSAFSCGIAVLPASATQTQTASLPAHEAPTQAREAADSHLDRSIVKIDDEAKEALREAMRAMQLQLRQQMQASRPVPQFKPRIIEEGTAAPSN